MLPLEGVTVLDFSTLLPGPLASLMLAEAGADVIKVERPGTGDETRGYPGDIDGESVCFAMLNRGKTSLAIDLKSDAGLATLDPYLEKADILLEQFRPGVMDRLGLGYQALSERFPRLIYCSISGYGQTGPKAQAAGHDLNYIAQTGLLSLSMGPVSEPVVPPALIADIAGGTYPAVINILLALEARRKTGRGCHIDVSMTDNMFPLMWWALAQHATTGAAPGNADETLNGGGPRYHLYPTSDGRVVAAAPLEDRFWARFCDAIDLPVPLRDDTFHAEATLAEVRRIIAARSAAEWAVIFAEADCCCTLVEDMETALADPHFQARGLFDRKLRVGSQSISALPLPIAPGFLRDGETGAPALGAAPLLKN
ncbi:MAG: CoA transferase [Pseudomonadota bacterium]